MLYTYIECSSCDILSWMSGRSVSATYLNATQHRKSTSSRKLAMMARRLSACCKYGEYCAWMKKKIAEMSVPMSTRVTLIPASCITPRRMRRRAISTSSHQKEVGSYSACRKDVATLSRGASRTCDAKISTALITHTPMGYSMMATTATT